MEIVAVISVFVSTILCFYGFGMFIGNSTRNNKIGNLYYTLGALGGIGMLVGLVYFTII